MSAPDLDPRNITALMRLDHNRALSQISAKTGLHTTALSKMIVWGNHSVTQYPDISVLEANGAKVWPTINDEAWYVDTFIPTVAKRGAAIIEARGLSSAASAANAAIEHIRDWALGTPAGDWVTMGVPSDGSYGIPEGVVYGFPVTCANGTYSIVQGIEINDFSRARMDATYAELLEERDGVKHLW
jgi:malate dehydrogenase